MIPSGGATEKIPSDTTAYMNLLYLYVFVVPYVYLLYYVSIAVLTLDAGLLARSRVLRPATSIQVFLGFPVSTCEC